MGAARRASRESVARSPELEGEERVELLPVVPTEALVLGHQPFDRLRAKQAPAADRVTSAHVSQERTERAAADGSGCAAASVEARWRV